MKIFRILDILGSVILFQEIFAYTYTSKDCVKLSYNFRFKQSCRGDKKRTGILPEIALPECVKECGMRPNCKALNYKRRYNACYLYSSQENEGNKRPGDDCTGDKTSDSGEQTGNKYTECKYIKPPLNGKTVGNMNGVGDHIQYKCEPGYKVPKKSEYAVCQPGGKWSVIVDKCTKETNVALRKQTVMSSVLYGKNGSLGVDGNTNHYFSGGSCFHTERETDPWWRVDLGAIYNIVNVTLFNRIDECETGECGYRARHLRLSMGTTLESMNIVGTVPGQIDDIHTFSFPEDKQARYVQVTLEGEKVLHLCEVQVFGFPIN